MEQEVSHLGQLASQYRFTDIDGSQPDIWRYMEDRACGIDAHLEAYRRRIGLRLAPTIRSYVQIVEPVKLSFQSER